MNIEDMYYHQKCNKRFIDYVGYIEFAKLTNNIKRKKKVSMEMIKKVITYKDPYGNIYKTNPIPASLVESKICSIQRTNDNNATIISVQ